MAELGTLQCSTLLKSLGSLGCQLTIGQVLKFLLAKKGTEIDPTDPLLDPESPSYDPQLFLEGKILDGTFVIFPNAVSVTAEAGDSVLETQGSGVNTKIRQALYNLTWNFDNGICTHRGIHSYDKQHGLFEVFLVSDDNPSALIGHNVNGKLRGFSPSLFDAQNMTLSDGSVATKTPFAIQMNDSAQLNKNISFIDFSVNLKNIDPVTELNITVNGATETQIDVTVTDSCNSSETMKTLGTEVSNWLLIDSSGLPVTISAVDDTNASVGKYALAGTFAIGDYTLQLNGVVKDTGVNFVSSASITALSVA